MVLRKTSSGIETRWSSSTSIDVVNDEMKRLFGSNYTPGRNNAPAPTPLYEPDDMIIIEPPCHPWEPLKVPEECAPMTVVPSA